MFVLNDIKAIEDNSRDLLAGSQHRLTFELSFTLYEVPDTFTGTVFEDAEGQLKLEHFNKPRGNRRKMFTLKNKLAPGTFKQIEACIFAFSRGEDIQLPQNFEAKKLSSRTMGG